MSELFYNGRNLTTYYGCKVTSVYGKYKTPVKEYEVQKVLERDGDILIDKHRLQNITIKYDCYISENFAENFSNLIDYLLSVSGYTWIWDTYDLPRKIQGYFFASVEPKVSPNGQGGKFSLSFSCYPEWVEMTT